MDTLGICERSIISTLLDDAAALGLHCSVSDGQGFSCKLTPDYRRVRAVVGATDESVLQFRDTDAPSAVGRRGVLVGSVVLRHGLGYDVIHDFSEVPAMRDLLRGAFDTMDIFASGGTF